MKASSARPVTIDGRARGFVLSAAMGSVLVGLPYALRLFGSVEAEVVHWGRVAIGLDSLLLALACIVRGSRITAGVAAVLAALAAAVAMLQVPPAILWVLFHGQPITDGSPPGGFVGHWALSLPHVALAALALAVPHRLLRARGVAGTPDLADAPRAHRSAKPTDRATAGRA